MSGLAAMQLDPTDSSVVLGDSPTLAYGKVCDCLPEVTDTLTRTPIPTIPKRLGGYEVKGELGRGGMGVVYEGYDPILRRSVALKVLIDGHSSNAQFQQRLRTEAEAVAQLQHPHIVQVHEIGWHDGAPFLALEFLSGGSLAQIVAGKPLPPKVAAKHLRDLAGAVAHAHEHGVVHRDLKPGNVLFTANGTPKITDFGIARLKDKESNAHSGLTQMGQVIGTPQYMAPEQASGDPNAVGPAADIYSLGAILYELLTGQPPFHDADTARVFAALKERDPELPRKLQPNLPRDLETICLKCLEKEPHRRYENAAELANDLNRFLMGDPIRARPAGVFRRSLNYARKHPATAGMILGVFIAGLLGLSAFGWQFSETLSALAGARASAHEARANANEARINQEESERQKTVAEANLAEAEWNLYLGRIAQSQLLVGQSKISAARDLLVKAPKLYRHWEWHYLLQHAGDALWSFSFRESVHTDQGLWVFRQALSPDGTRLAVVANNPYGGDNTKWYENPTSLVVLNVSDGKPLLILPEFFNSNCSSLFWVSDQNLSLVDYYGNLSTLDVVANRTIFTSASPKFERANNEIFRHSAVNPTGTVFARTGPNYTVDIIDPLGKRKTRSVRVPKDTPHPVGLSPDGSIAVLRGSEVNDIREERIVELATGKTLLYWPGQWVGSSFSPDGKWLFTAPSAGSRCTVTLWDTTTWKSVWKHTIPLSGSGAAVFSPDSQRLVVQYLGDGHEIHGYDTATGENHVAFRGHESAVRGIGFSPDGRWVASTSDDNSVRLWDAQTGGLLQRFRGHENCSRTVDFTRDGRSVITGGSDEKVICWDLARIASAGGMMPLPSSGGVGTEIGALGFTPEGRITTLSTRSGLLELDADTSNPVRRTPLEGLARRDAKEVTDFQFSADGTVVGGKAADGRDAALWNPATGKMIRQYPTGFDRLWSVALSHDGNRFAASGDNKGFEGNPPRHRLFIWEAQTGKVLLEKSFDERVISIAFAPNNRFAVGFLRRADRPGPAISIFDANGTLERDIETKPSKDQDLGLHAFVNNLLFSADGHTLAASCLECSQIILFDPDTGAERKQLPFDNMVTALDFSPDGQRLAAIGYTDHVSLYSTSTGVNVITIVGATGRENDWAFPAKVKFSPDGRTLAATHWTGDVSIWHVESLNSPEVDPARVRVIAEKSAFRFHLHAVRAALDRDDSATFDFHASRLDRLPPPTDALRDDWKQLKLRANARSILPALAGSITSR